MKITFLGTSHGDPTQTRQQSAALLETQGRYYLIDAGDGAATRMIRSGIFPAMITGIFITHMHLDHSSGLPVILEQAIKHRKKYPNIDPAVRLPDPRAEKILRSWIEINGVPKVQSLDIQTSREGIFYDDGFIKMEAFQTKHLEWSAKNPELKSYSFRITAEGKRCLFTGDLCGDFSDFPFDAASDSDLLVSELVHFPIEKAYEYLKDLKIGRLIFNHLANRWQDSKEIPYALGLFKSVPYPVEFGYDGMSIEV